MPRVRPLTEERRRAQREAEFFDDVREQLRVLCALLPMKKQDIQRALAVSAPTMRAKMEDPGRLTLRDLYCLAELARDGNAPLRIVLEGRRDKAQSA